ncbi:MAG: GGDEF domain-containing protein [Lachnospiraceae bacterium]|nr:GGDEF domain-containing protein [Lachnospiraceae bacterium]MBR6150577.1 GGDEF domain-containing protein [Lachnospiraceae bacterium]
MGNDYFLFYAEGNIVCIFILLIILINDLVNNTKQEKQIRFNSTITAHILYFTLDIIWAAILGGQLPKIRFLIVLLNFANYVNLSLMAYEWFTYMAVSEGMTFWKSKRNKLICLLPMIVSALGIIIAYVIKPYYWISETGELNDTYHLLHIAAPAVYLLVALVLSMRNARKAETREDQKIYRLIGLYPIVVFFFGVLQILVLNSPAFCFGVTVMLLFFYIQNMQTRISIDALTRLNNRGQINRYVDQLRYQDNVRIFVMMMDLDHFKQINDTYGHAEGDRALILAAEVLKRTCERVRTPIFLGRYGGDEFTIILQNPEAKNHPEQLMVEIRGNLAKKKEENQLPYALEASIGYEELRDENDSMQECIMRADEKLYADKQSRRIKR